MENNIFLGGVLRIKMTTKKYIFFHLLYSILNKQVRAVIILMEKNIQNFELITNVTAPNRRERGEKIYK